MAKILPEVLGETYFGDPEAPLPDWRAARDMRDGVEYDPDEPDSKPLSPDARRALVALLGFDPRKIAAAAAAAAGDTDDEYEDEDEPDDEDEEDDEDEDDDMTPTTPSTGDTRSSTPG